MSQQIIALIAAVSIQMELFDMETQCDMATFNELPCRRSFHIQRTEKEMTKNINREITFLLLLIFLVLVEVVYKYI